MGIEFSAKEAALPSNDVQVDFGQRYLGFSEPMPPEVRAAYEERIRAGAEATPGVYPYPTFNWLATENFCRDCADGCSECGSSL